MWPNLPEPPDLVTFTEEIINRKLQFLCSDYIEQDDILLKNASSYKNMF